MEKIIIKGVTHNGLSIIKNHEGEGSVEETWSFREIRIGLHWPSAGSPGYFCLVGQGSIKTFDSNHPLRLLRESEEILPSKLFEKMCDVAGTFECQEIFCDLSEKFRGYVLNFRDFKRKERRQQDIFLRQAPYHQEFGHGILTIKDWLGRNALVIPKGTIVAQQLGSITDGNLAASDASERFYAIDALRHVVSAFGVHFSISHHGNLNSAAPPSGAWH
ncbi:MAG: hypothetical protein FJ115_04775 [Deltaproteobacteria bacterium]|nr:hypothetical protein [Deltaproteobacteria bacterium]MBM4322857.1 hypothetical protein [Deltaproteobacteria bacterium]